MTGVENGNNISKNITNSIKNDIKINILKSLYCDEKYINGSASDFEWFDIWERASLFCVGHSELKNYEQELSAIDLPLVSFSRVCRNEIISRWRVANRLDMLSSLAEQRSSGTLSYEYLSPAKEVGTTNGPILVDLEKYVSEFTNIYNDVETISASIYEKVISLENPYIIMAVNIEHAEYVRPDPYKAKHLILKKNSGEFLNSIEENIITSQLLIELLIKLKDEKNIILLLDEKGGLDWTVSYLRYLVSRRLYLGEVWLSAKDRGAFSDIFTASAELYPYIHVRPYIDLDMQKLSSEELCDIFSVYPVGAFVIRGGGRDDTLLQALETVSQSREHARFLREHISIKKS